MQANKDLLDNLIVYETRAEELGMVQPQEEKALDHVIKGDPLDQEAHGVFRNGEETEHHPVGEPLSIIDRLGRFDGLEGHVGGVRETEEVGHQLHPTHGVNDGCDNRDDAEEEVNLWLAGFLFEVAEFVCVVFDENEGGMRAGEMAVKITLSKK